ncbi:hypothetical protein ERJ75_000248000 [Trypanosoma vivax]|uniref:Uncharacterized protein n=1 Tax=Trypanosoma vivax (strain Y486) TaxID=1055687 RepID=G0U1U9_TRYVY|nr:hypothetical protein ERJ75_000248000 [Trypanosoma vivax]CCC50248.1 hypothetical protein TVY486_0900710 [Trypanosoma vivax Y486]
MLQGTSGNCSLKTSDEDNTCSQLGVFIEKSQELLTDVDAAQNNEDTDPYDTQCDDKGLDLVPTEVVRNAVLWIYPRFASIFSTIEKQGRLAAKALGFDETECSQRDMERRASSNKWLHVVGQRKLFHSDNEIGTCSVKVNIGGGQSTTPVPICERRRFVFARRPFPLDDLPLETMS